VTQPVATARICTACEYFEARFRFENDRIAELWDIAQEVPAESMNSNGMF
jgi:hypothetical protein